ncbi:MAG: hypothetical protein QOJ00_2677 [Actinomycetota bacterium]|jgi:hypothetical protein
MPLHATVEFEDGNLVVRPAGIAVCLALRTRLTLPLSAITSVEINGQPGKLKRRLRLAGTAIPGLIYAGVFGFTKPRSFWVVGRARPLVMVNAAGVTYEQVVFYSDDPTGTKAKIDRAITRSA